MSGNSSTTDRPAFLRYGVAILALALAVVVRMPLQPLLGETTPFLFFFPAIMLAAWYGGFGPGLLATGLSAVTANYFFMAPRFTFGLPNLSSAVHAGFQMHVAKPVDLQELATLLASLARGVGTDSVRKAEPLR